MFYIKNNRKVIYRYINIITNSAPFDWNQAKLFQYIILRHFYKKTKSLKYSHLDRGVQLQVINCYFNYLDKLNTHYINLSVNDIELLIDSHGHSPQSSLTHLALRAVCLSASLTAKSRGLPAGRQVLAVRNSFNLNQSIQRTLQIFKIKLYIQYKKVYQ